MNNFNCFSVVSLMIVAAISICQSEGGTISPSLVNKLSSGDYKKVDAILELPSILDTVLSHDKVTRLRGVEKASYMENVMKELASESQAPFMSVIKQFGAADKVDSFFVANIISLKDVDLSIIKALSSLQGNFTIREPFIIKREPNPLPSDSLEYNSTTITKEIQWGVKQIGAHSVWGTYGVTGRGIIVANIDTGVYRDHESLRNNYAGGWLDAVNGLSEPYDDDGHGTHTMGTICGQTRGVGVAPGASWIACKALNNQGEGTEDSLLRCGQWLIQQRPLPRIINNSWGTDYGDQIFYNDVISVWRSVGIIPVFSIGNGGPQCYTTISPGDQDGVISVGSTDYLDNISESSSRGPALYTNRIKPEVSAPGDYISSASNTGTKDYVAYSGTSMAAPHVTGAIALMLEANPKLGFEDVLNKLTDNAYQPKLSWGDLECDVSSTYPNNVYGHGRINVSKVFEAADF